MRWSRASFQVFYFSLRGRPLHHSALQGLTINTLSCVAKRAGSEPSPYHFNSNLWKKPAVPPVYYKALLANLKIKVLIHYLAKRKKGGGATSPCIVI